MQFSHLLTTEYAGSGKITGAVIAADLVFGLNNLLMKIFSRIALFKIVMDSDMEKDADTQTISAFFF